VGPEGGHQSSGAVLVCVEKLWVHAVVLHVKNDAISILIKIIFSILISLVYWQLNYRYICSKIMR
jgi:Co/Zn/Cd efflux system component